MTVLPLTSSATQNAAETHDTLLSPAALSATTGLVHSVPLYVSAFPLPSTAAQKVADVHDTEVGLPAVSTLAGAAHVPPLYTSAAPLLSIAVQREPDTQETEASPTPSTLAGELHFSSDPEPVSTIALPLLSTATQKEVDEARDGRQAGAGVGRRSRSPLHFLRAR